MLWAAAALAVHHLVTDRTIRAADAAMTTLIIGSMVAILAHVNRALAIACVALPVTLIVVGLSLERLILPAVHGS